jgi:hypothetical protein
MRMVHQRGIHVEKRDASKAAPHDAQSPGQTDISDRRSSKSGLVSFKDTPDRRRPVCVRGQKIIRNDKSAAPQQSAAAVNQAVD